MFEGIAYRAVRMTDPSAANLYRILGKTETGQENFLLLPHIVLMAHLKHNFFYITCVLEGDVVRVCWAFIYLFNKFVNRYIVLVLDEYIKGI
jgi:hypothetical protein